MNDSDVESFLIIRLAESRGSTHEEVMHDVEHGGAIDSLEGVELVVEAEQAFGVTIPDKELSSDVCRSISAMAALVRSKLGRGSGTEGGERQ